MSEFLVSTQPVGPLKVGDVAAVVDDGWKWGSAERGQPRWGIICCPDVSVSEGAALLSQELVDQLVKPGKHYRAFGLKLDGLDLSTPLLMQAAEFRSRKYAKPPSEQYDVIGDEYWRIG